MEYVLHPQQPGYPFSLRFNIEYALLDNGQRVWRTATNIGVDACPYGNGPHPYLTLGTDTVDRLILHAPAGTMLRSDGRGLPTLDHAFTDPKRDEEDGLARVTLRDPDYGTAVSLWVDESYPYPMLFTGDPLPDAPAQPCRRTHDLPAERISDRERSDQAGAGLLVHKLMGHRSQRAHRP